MDSSTAPKRPSALSSTRARLQDGWNYIVHGAKDCRSRTAEDMWSEQISPPVLITGPLLIRTTESRTPEEENVEYHHTYFLDDLRNLNAIRKDRQQRQAARRAELLPTVSGIL